MNTVRLHVTPAEGQPFDHTFESDSLVVGRAVSSDLALTDDTLSRHHMKLSREGERLIVEDLDSRNGTFLNGERIREPVSVQPGDVIKICDSFIAIQPGEPSADASDLPSTELLDPYFQPASVLLDSQTRVETADIEEVDALRHYADRIKLLNEVHQVLSGSISRDDLLELVLDRVFDHLQPEDGAIFLRREEGDLFRCACRALPGVEADFLYSRTLVTEVAEKGQTALVLDAQTDERFDAAQSILTSGIRSIVAAPLLDPEGGDSLGMIVLSSSVQVRQFSEEDMELLVSMAAIAALRLRNLDLAEDAAERRRIEEQLTLARHIQETLLPRALPDVEGYELKGNNVPSQGVSGDYYQVLERLDGKECVLMMADVSGKGIGASLLTTALEALSAGPIEDGLAPHEICVRISNLLHARTPAEQFATVFVGVLDPASGQLRYANAGHNPPLLVRRDGEVVLLGCTGMPIGLLAKTSYRTDESVLEGGDTLVIYTDGITEAINPQEEEFGAERLADVCRENRSKSLGELESAIEEQLQAFTRGVPFADDRTLVLARRLE